MNFDVEIDDDTIWDNILEDYDIEDLMDQVMSKYSVIDILDNLPEGEISSWYEENVVNKV